MFYFLIAAIVLAILTSDEVRKMPELPEHGDLNAQLLIAVAWPLLVATFGMQSVLFIPELAREEISNRAEKKPIGKFGRFSIWCDAIAFGCTLGGACLALGILGFLSVFR